jgi:hypothetical protein
MSETERLLKAYLSIQDAKIRKALLMIIEKIANAEGPDCFANNERPHTPPRVH